jgi:ADP-ribose pyrophosphatase YjhB (NUDIX family)
MNTTPVLSNISQTSSFNPIIPRITARIFIEKDNHYLYLRQTNERGGQLSLPGGRVKNKEFIKKGLIREVQEETNLTVVKKELRPIHTLHRKENDEFEIVIFFEAQIDNAADLALNEPEKFQEFVWVDKNEIPENLIKEFRHVLKNVKKQSIFSEFPKKKKISAIEIDLNI